MFNKLINNKYAFSMVEMMLLLLIASLIVAASVPLITRKHLSIPSTTNHGSYMCYYQNGKLMEARRSGRVQQKLLSGYPRETTNCVFEPPAKATMFQITAIGGGGGGGDAGYNGSAPTTYHNPDQELNPFPTHADGNYLSKDDLAPIIDINNSDALNEIVSHFAKFWAYAEGYDTSLPGSIYYAALSTTDKKHECPDTQKNKEWKDQEVKSGSKSFNLCNGVGGQKKIEPNIYICYDSNRHSVGGYYEYPAGDAGKATCTKTEQILSGCIWPNGEEYIEEEVTVYTTEEQTTYLGDSHTYIEEDSCTREMVDCPNVCTYIGQTNCNKPGTKCPSYEACKEEHCVDDGKHEQCYITQVVYKPTTVKLKRPKPCTNQYENKTTTWKEEVPSGNTTWGTITGNCEKVSYIPSGAANMKYRKETIGCNLSDEALTTKIPKYEKKEMKISDDLRAGKGAFCLSNVYKGYLPTRNNDKFTFKILYLSSSDVLPRGDDINKDVALTGTHSFCGFNEGLVTCTKYPDRPNCGLGFCGPSMGRTYRNGLIYLSYVFLNHVSIRATAPTVAKGPQFEQASVSIPIFTGYANNDEGQTTGIATKDVTYYYDSFLSPEQHGVDGGCKGTGLGTYTDAEKVQRDCRKAKSHKAGYCMLHYDKTDVRDAEENGVYRYHDTYDKNSLPKGLSGEPGQYKTIVVRSLSGVDRTIVVGRGGSAATLNLGGDGSRGSDTSFGGDLLVAEGGAGGKGSQPGVEETLPTIDDTLTAGKLVKLKACFTSFNINDLPEADRGTCRTWRQNPSEMPFYKFYKNTSDTQDIYPTKVLSGGMFSHVMSAFGVGGNDSLAEDLAKYAGKAGSGGGVEHFCWAGARKMFFEGHELTHSSKNLPQGCATAFRNVPAASGNDGALIISW